MVLVKLLLLTCLYGLLQSFQSKLSFSSKEIVALSCSWCKTAYHNKEACFNLQKIGEECNLGKALLLPFSSTHRLRLNTRKIISVVKTDIVSLKYISNYLEHDFCSLSLSFSLSPSLSLSTPLKLYR